MIKTSFPGKLFLMGEYAVMNTGHKAVISAVDRYLHVELKASDHWDIVSSFGHYQGEAVFDMLTMPEVSSSLKTVRQYLKQDLKPAKITILSELDSGDKKYGFGSSGVVIVALVSALLQYHDQHLSRNELFKLCVLVQKDLNQFSSGADLASSIYGGTIVYARYDLQWLLKQEQSVQELITVVWPSLIIEPLILKPDMELVIGWTGKSNITSHYTKAVHEMAKKDPMTYRAFLLSSQRGVNDFIAAKDYSDIKDAVAFYRKLMQELEKWAHIEIETQELQYLIELSLEMGFAAKVSGSGGGDCGFSLVPKEQCSRIPALKNQWLSKNIEMMRE